MGEVVIGENVQKLVDILESTGGDWRVVWLPVLCAAAGSLLKKLISADPLDGRHF